MEAPGKPFLMHIGDIFWQNQGRVVMLIGLIERGRGHKGDAVEIVGFGGTALVGVEEIEAFRQYVDKASAGMSVGLLIRGTAVGEVERGQVLAAPGSISAHTSFAADVTLLSEERGAAEMRTGERLRFHFGTAAVAGDVTPTGELDVLHPLPRGDVTITLERPVALEEGQSFAFRHRGRAAGSGHVMRLLN
ncbi:EF-Tu/IF-2/RF-3 family GTPase, partial [Streptomyces sp. NRRL S-920]|uniref:EF-Tu C-terminal domain-related protein n=1 Tax=Streptomyces sp. NRRL S-920 TaxID=1463921 RepID=UPI0004CAB2CB